MKIREFKTGDIQDLFETLSDPEVMTYIEDPYTYEQTQELLDDVMASGNPSIHAAEDDNGNYIGYVIFHEYEDDSYELGWILKRAEWGKGYASRLTEMMIDKARKLGVNAVIECDPGQEVTKHIAEKHGFVFDEIFDGCEVYRLKLV
ncbi:MAG: GNAT family N-acetyltransferase [Lachnospiraceae bacterium]|nr:GNAT family N-acetyltransferase [Lachnospiraceae bacterium]